MPVFISYNRDDSKFVDDLAKNLVVNRHDIWLDRWEMNIGDSLIEKIQSALTDSSAILVILSKKSVASEWCKKELHSGLVRELAEKKVLLLPCVIDDCEIPLFLREKLYADFRTNPDQALSQVHDALLRITNQQQGRLESPDFHTDWAYSWSRGKSSGLWYFDFTFVDHGAAVEHCVLTQCRMGCNEVASETFQQLSEPDRRTYCRQTFATLIRETSKRRLKIQLSDAFEKFEEIMIDGVGEEAWLVEIASRRMGIDNGKDTLVHVDQIFERALAQMEARSGRRPD